MFLKRPFRLVTFLLSLALLIGCGGEETAGPDPVGETSLGEATDSLENLLGESVDKTVEKVQQLTGASLDLTYVTEDFTGAIIVHPARVLNSDFVKSLIEAGLPLEDALQKPIDEFGIDPHQIDQVVVLIDNATASAAPMMLPFGGPPGGQPGGFDFPQEEVPSVEPEKLEEKAPDNSNQGAIDRSSNRLQPVAFQIEDAIGDAEGELQEPMPTIIVRFSEPIDADKFFSNPNAPPMEDAEIDGLKVKKVGFPEGVFYFPNPKTLIVTRPTLLKNMVETKAASSDLISELKQVDPSSDLIVVADLTPVRPALEEASELLALFIPPGKEALGLIPTKTKLLRLTGGISNQTLLSLSLVMDSADDVTAVNKVVSDGLTQARTMYEQQKVRGLPPNVPLSSEEQKELMKVVDEVMGGIASKADGNRLTVSIPKPNDLGRVVQLLKPAIEQAKKAAEGSVRKNNLRQIGLAFHNFLDTFKAFPAAGADWSGEKKGLSWRVHILPYLDQAALYNQFNLDEPWDSEHNKALISQMPEVYKTEGVDDPTKTALQVFLGDSAFSLDEGRKISNYTDGLSNTILVVEAAPEKAEVWTKPGGLTLNEDDPLSTLGSYSSDTFLVLFADGAVRALSTMIDPETLKALVTMNGEEPPGDF